MKIDRLIGIIATLQQKKRVTMPYLAEQFEVSRRTISRDIEEISRAGIPIVATQGMNGGVSLMEGFSLDTTVFTREELSAVFTGLQSLDSVSKSAMTKRMLNKLGGDTGTLSNRITIDLSSFYKEDLADKIQLIRQAMERENCIAFRYCSSRGEEDKLIEPHILAFQWSDWYVFGFCRARRDFRMFKLRRLWNLSLTEEKFTFREIPEERRQFGSHMTDDYRIRVLVKPSAKYRLVEAYGPHSFKEQEDGMLLFERGFTYPGDAVDWLLAFGDQAQVIEPAELVQRMKEKITNMAKMYET